MKAKAEAKTKAKTHAKAKTGAKVQAKAKVMPTATQAGQKKGQKTKTYDNFGSLLFHFFNHDGLDRQTRHDEIRQDDT